MEEVGLSPGLMSGGRRAGGPERDKGFERCKKKYSLIFAGTQSGPDQVGRSSGGPERDEGFERCKKILPHLCRH